MMRLRNRAAVLAVVLNLMAGCIGGARGDVSDVTEQSRLTWWKDAKFGMFMHWGLYSVLGGEWQGKSGGGEQIMRQFKIPIAEYEKIAPRFNPTKFNADTWAQIAHDAGMKYLIITSKHHDGFAMWDSKCDSYNVVKRTPFARDPMKELSDACPKHDVKFGMYYSLGRDWHDPDVPTTKGERTNTWDFPDLAKMDIRKYYARKALPQVKELMADIKPAVLWFDTPQSITADESRELVKTIHEMDPTCIINSRVGHGLGDYEVVEQKIPTGAEAKPWETCMTIGRNWCYTKADTNFKSTQMLLQNLVDVVSKGGNYLLNIGPTPEGEIPAQAVERLRQIGVWMKVNGEAIYGTTATPFGDELKGDVWRCTTKPGKLYLHFFTWPDGKFELSGVKGKVGKAYLLADSAHAPLGMQQDGGKVTLTLPAKAPDEWVSVVVIELDTPK